MIDEVRRVGIVVGGNEKNWSPPTKKILRVGEKDADKYLRKVVFDLDQKKVYLGDEIKVDAQLTDEYLFYGDVGRGSNSPKTHVTTKKLENITWLRAKPKERTKNNGPVFHALVNTIEKHELDSYQGLMRLRVLSERVLNDFYIRTDKDGYQLAEPYRKALNPNKDDILFTVTVVENKEEIDFAKIPEYKKIIEKEYLSSESRRGICHICHLEKSDVKKDPSFKNGTLLKMFNVDKRGFFKNLEKGGSFESFSICEECLKQAHNGNQFITDNRFNIISEKSGNLFLFVVPDIDVNEVNKEHLNNGLSQLRASITGNNSSYDRLKMGIVSALEKWRKITLVFASMQSSKIDVRKVIDDVPPSRFEELDYVFERVSIRFAKEFGAYKWNMHLSFPGIMPKSTANKYRLYTEIFSALINGYQCDFIQKLAVKRFQEDLYSREKYPFKTFLKYVWLGVVIDQASGRSGEEVNMTEKGDVEKWLKDVGYSDAQKALFYVGQLLAEIARYQWKRNNNKSVLNKLNYSGMTADRVKRFMVELSDYIKMYGLEKNGLDVALYAKAFDEINRHNAEMGDAELNVFYILSGYAYQTGRMIQAATESSKEEVSQVEQ